MTTLKKLQQARQKLKEEPVKKLGHNSYSKYDYFTPEQISGMVAKVNNELNLFHKFDLVREQYGLMARLEIFDLESEDSIQFQIATEIPEIKATNVAQQLGGCVTYSERYLLQLAYDIKDNNLDFDTEKPEKKPALTPQSEAWIKAVEYLKGDGTITDIKVKYGLTKENEELLLNQSI